MYITKCLRSNEIIENSTALGLLSYCIIMGECPARRTKRLFMRHLSTSLEIVHCTVLPRPRHTRLLMNIIIYVWYRALIDSSECSNNMFNITQYDIYVS